MDTCNGTAAVARLAGLKRCGKSCWLRWVNYLRSNINSGGFAEEEDDVICSLYFTIGSRQVMMDDNLRLMYFQPDNLFFLTTDLVTRG